MEQIVERRSNYKWTYQDNLTVFAMYQLRIDHRTRKFKALMQHLGMPESSVKSAYHNHEYLDGIGNFSEVSVEAEEIHETYKYTPLSYLVAIIENTQVRAILEGRLSTRRKVRVRKFPQIGV
jgi:hypothetical protein